MSEQRYRYASVGITEEKEVPAVLLGKRNATFEIAGMEYERTAILKLPEKMNQTEFDTWKESGGIDLIDMFFHCIHQKSVRADPPDAGERGEQADLMTDGGEVTEPTEEEIEHRFRCSRKQLLNLQDKLADTHSEAFTTVSRLIAKLDETEEEVKELVLDDAGEPEAVTDGGDGSCPSCGEEGERLPELSENLRACMNLGCRVNEFEVNATATDGGSSMPKMALEHLKELDETDDKIGEWLSEKVGEPIGGMTDLYASEHSIPDAMNEVELGEGFSVKEPEYIELLTLLDSGREAAANDPPTLGVRNRLLMQLILANPEAYARIRKEMEERAKEAQEEMKRRMNEERHRQQMTERAADLNGEGVDIPLDDEEENDGE